jgi:SAM-dependent methyltransferase
MFGFVLLYGAPYLPTQRKQAAAALDLMGLKKGQTLYEFGCGDGRVLKLAAARGLHGVGYELNPLLVLIARLHTWKYRKTVRIIWGSFWRADISGADGIFVFLLDKFMPRLDRKIKSEAGKALPLASYTFKIPGKKEAEYRDGVYLYRYK